MSINIFFDRDGVLNYPIYYNDTKKFEAPRTLKDFKLYEFTLSSLKKIKLYNKLFIISNQPNYVLGKSTFKNTIEIKNYLVKVLAKENINITKHLYSYNHKNSRIKKYSNTFNKKPSPFFINYSIEKYKLDRSKCWIVGDNDTDIQAGISAKINCIKIGKSSSYKHISNFKNLTEACKYLSMLNYE